VKNSAEPKWTSSVIDRRLEKAVAPELKPLGFKKEKYSFTRHGLDCYQEVFVGPISSSGFLQRLGMSFHVSCEAINRVTSCYFRAPVAVRSPSTEIRTLSFREQPPERLEFEVTGFDELEKTTPIFLAVFQDRGLRFLDATNTIAGIDKLLNTDESRAEFPWLDDWERVALVAAFLNNNPDFDRIAERALQHSQSMIATAHEVRLLYLIPHEKGLPLLINDLRNGTLRDYDRDGEHPLLPELPDPVEERKRYAEANARANARATAEWIALHGDPADRGYGSSELEPPNRYPFGEVYESVQLSGFDSDGEPTIRVYPEGHLMVVFEFMPPEAWEMDGGDLGDFGNEMAEAIGLDMSEEQTGFFLVANPAKDTTERITTFVSTYRQTHGYNP
jgi:hypothetical protein